MTEINQFFRPVGAFCRRDIVTCAPDDDLVPTVREMSTRNISSMVVCADGAPVGIFTDRDLRNKVVARGLAPASLTVADVMNAPLAVIAENEVIYRALYRMSRERIHRLGVVDATGRLAGIITDSDILRLQAHSPHHLVLDIERAERVEDLHELHARIQALVLHLSGSGIAIRELLRLIAHLNDQIVIRLIALLRAERHRDLPDGFAFVVMGSEGRSEQTLSTDQDNAIIYSDALNADEIARIERFSVDLIDTLIAIGVPPCPGGIMAKNAAWRRSLGDWRREIDRWLDTPTPDNIMTGSMFLDLRTLHGDATLELALRTHVFAHVARDRGFLMRMAQNMTRFTPPLGWFGKVKGERSGEHKGELDIKKAGIFAITDGIKALALEARNLAGGTHDRIDALEAAGVLKPADAREWRAALDFLVQLRLRGHVEALRAGRTPSNYVELERLSLMEQADLRIALESVERFQGFIKHHFSLSLLHN
ncbi:MAG: putative nucleotidyltransferase substrate binding domain-containing protein [Rhodocyclaceae bacterium]